MLKRNLPLVITILVFILGYGYCLSQYPGFASTRVIGDLLTDNAFLGIVAVGMTFVILSGGIDLSVGSTIAFTGVLLAKLIGQYGIDPAYAFVIVLVMGTLYGAMTGWIIDTLKLPAFIITLASMFFLRGMSFIVSRESVPIDHPVYASLANFAWRMPGGGRLTLLALVMLLVVALGMLLAHRTRFGNNVYAIGGNPYSAGLMGVPVKRTTVQIYMLSSLLAVLSGIVFSLYTSAGYALAASGVELDAIAAVVIGGTLLTGGVGTVLGTLFGVMIQGLIQTYITFDGTLSSWWTKIVIGILLFGFIGLQKALSAFWLSKRSVGTAAVSKPA
ncbi:galactofuranose ABC transporter, permease protein YjfF [Biostraticola tofi]|uniref:Monosaccharide ABC transporter membrane protein (CUT2 family) n=1 Tax=Biostraticola tofi TaxID=466109 RepID=A0A4R3YN56_9GAMM|nr:galactofuranose ABC transporter, permease protein YjfF [Biostraticola tofi]TCV93756.1 monosaccharide ABC transporter membrane protein (CUT2 family) [Biostraticola tofi]